MKIARRKMAATVPSFAMGDIGFLLLIFFVILARVQDDSHVQWDPAILSDLEGAGATLANVAIDSAYKTYLNGEEIKNQLLGPRLNAI
ncbi:MAG: biopolymer transporter ExbD, partial [Verrucomicrobiota bacterium]|nr:biopolymer transporter ExbD [Verrucomicrobiota bacterium]